MWSMGLWHPGSMGPGDLGCFHTLDSHGCRRIPKYKIPAFGPQIPQYKNPALLRKFLSTKFLAPWAPLGPLGESEGPWGPPAITLLQWQHREAPDAQSNGKARGMSCQVVVAATCWAEVGDCGPVVLRLSLSLRYSLLGKGLFALKPVKMRALCPRKGSASSIKQSEQ